METGIYIRVSTEEQVLEGFSIRGQEEKLRDYVRIKDWSLFNLYIDEGISGKNIKDRPAANRLIEDVRAGHVKNVLVYKIDRLTRSTSDLVFLVDLFNQYNCAFNSLMESIDTQTPSGRMFIKIIGIFAEFERENIIERVKMGRDRKVKEGYSLCSSHASYGYDREPGKKIQTINEEETEIVREIFDRYVNENMSLNSIVRLLNLRKIPSKKGKLWDRKNLKNLLTNASYIGKVRHFIDDEEHYVELEGLHEPIISEDLFEQAATLAEKNKATSSTKKPVEHNYYLGFLYCAKCGGKLSTHNRKTKLKDGSFQYHCSYRCQNNVLNGGCDMSGDINHKKVEMAFVEYIDRIADLTITDEIELEQAETVQQESGGLIQSYTDKLLNLEKRHREIMDSYCDGGIDFESYRHMKNKLDNDKALINAELAKLDNESNLEEAINHTDIITNIRENWELLANREKRQFLMKFVKRIVIENVKMDGARGSEAKIVEVEFTE